LNSYHHHVFSQFQIIIHLLNLNFKFEILRYQKEILLYPSAMWKVILQI